MDYERYYIYFVSEDDYLFVEYDKPFVRIVQKRGTDINTIVLMEDSMELEILTAALGYLLKKIRKKWK